MDATNYYNLPCSRRDDKKIKGKCMGCLAGDLGLIVGPGLLFTGPAANWMIEGNTSHSGN